MKGVVSVGARVRIKETSPLHLLYQLGGREGVVTVNDSNYCPESHGRYCIQVDGITTSQYAAHRSCFEVVPLVNKADALSETGGGK